MRKEQVVVFFAVKIDREERVGSKLVTFREFRIW